MTHTQKFRHLHTFWEISKIKFVYILNLDNIKQIYMSI